MLCTKASSEIVVKLIHYAVWTIQRMSCLAFEPCSERGRYHYVWVDPCLIWSSFSSCLAPRCLSAVSSGGWPITAELRRTRKGNGRRARLMKHTCRGITVEVEALPHLNQLSISIFPNGVIAARSCHTFQWDVVLWCRAIIQALSPWPYLTCTERANSLKWLPCITCGQVWLVFGGSYGRVWPLGQGTRSCHVNSTSCFYFLRKDGE